MAARADATVGGEMGLKAVRSAPTALDQVTAQMVEHLASGIWPVGTKLPSEAALAQGMNVSRPVVREAIRGLARLGMLEPRHGSGTYVRSSQSPITMLEHLDRAEIVEVFEVQMAYDVQAAGLAARRRTDVDLRTLRARLDARRVSEDDRTDPRRFADDDAAFHLEVVRIARNPLLEETYRYFVGRLREGLYRVHADVTIPACGHGPHADVFDAIADGDESAARSAACEVIRSAIESIESRP